MRAVYYTKFRTPPVVTILPDPTPANSGVLWANNDLVQPAGPAAGNPLSIPPPNSPAIHGGASLYSVDALGYVNKNLISGYNLISTPLGHAPSIPGGIDHLTLSRS